MASYSLTRRKSLKFDFRKIPRKDITRIITKIETLANVPRPKHCTKLSDEEYTYRVKSGDYRIIYEVDDKKKEVLIIAVRHRKDVYRKR